MAQKYRQPIKTMSVLDDIGGAVSGAVDWGKGAVSDTGRYIYNKGDKILDRFDRVAEAGTNGLEGLGNLLNSSMLPILIALAIIFIVPALLKK